MSLPHLTPNQIGDGVISDARGDLVADCYTIDQPAAKAAEVAAEVAMRCNMHPTLVSLLKETRQALNGLPNHTINNDRNRTTYGLVARIEAALKGLES